MPHGLNPLRRPVVQEDAKLHLVFRLRLDCTFDCSAPLLLVFRVYSLKALFPARRPLLRIKSVYPVPLIGKVQRGSSRHLPDPTASAAKPLRFRQICFAASERLLGGLALVNVHAGPVPSKDLALSIQ